MISATLTEIYRCFNKKNLYFQLFTGLCLDGRSYASGLSIGDATYFGRLAGRRMAAAEPWTDA